MSAPVELAYAGCPCTHPEVEPDDYRDSWEPWCICGHTLDEHDDETGECLMVTAVPAYRRMLTVVASPRYL